MAEKRKGSAEKSASQAGAVEVGIQLPIEWHSGPEIVTRYVNQATVQFGPKECHVSFFEIRPPFILDDDQEERKRKAQELKSIRAECVARIVVTHDFLPTLIQALQKVWDKTQQTVSEQNENKEANGNN